MDPGWTGQVAQDWHVALGGTRGRAKDGATGGTEAGGLPACARRHMVLGCKHWPQGGMAAWVIIQVGTVNKHESVTLTTDALVLASAAFLSRNAFFLRQSCSW